MTMTRLVRLNKKGQLVLPKEMSSDLGVKEGDELTIIKKDNYIMVTTTEHFAQTTRRLLKGTWGKNSAEIYDYINKERDMELKHRISRFIKLEINETRCA